MEGPGLEVMKYLLLPCLNISHEECILYKVSRVNARKLLLAAESLPSGLESERSIILLFLISLILSIALVLILILALVLIPVLILVFTLILILVLKPTGILGEALIEKV